MRHDPRSSIPICTSPLLIASATVIDCFGSDQLVWGSDHPAVTLMGSLTRRIEATRALIGRASEADQTKLFHGNARRTYKL